MSDVTERPDPQTPTRVIWVCPGCGQTHTLVEPRSEAVETAWNLLAGGVAFVGLEDNAAAVMREQDQAEMAHRIFSGPVIFGIDIDSAAPVVRKWWDLRRYRK